MSSIDKKDSLKNYTILKKLGKGSFGTVYLVKKKNTNKNYAMKKIDVSKYKNKRYKEAIHNEAMLLQKINSEYIIKIYSNFVLNDKLYLVMEYAQKGDLYQYVKNLKQQNKFLSEDKIWKIAAQIFQALNCIHSQNIIHRDVKPQNIFLDSDLNVKLGDFGVSKMLESISKNEYTKVGTPLYISPELVQNKKYDYKVDIWSTGCVLYYLASQNVPFKSQNLLTLSNLIVYKSPKPLKNISNNLQNFIFQCLNKNSKNRPDSQLCLDICYKQTMKLNNKIQCQYQAEEINQLNNKQNQNIFLSDIKKLNRLKNGKLSNKENQSNLNIKINQNAQKKVLNVQSEKKLKKNRAMSASASKLLDKIHQRNQNLKFKKITNFPSNEQQSLQKFKSNNFLQCYKINHHKENKIKSLQNFNSAKCEIQIKNKQKENNNFLSFYFQNYVYQQSTYNNNYFEKKQRPNTAFQNNDDQKPLKNILKVFQRPQSALKLNQNFRIN